MCTFLSDKILIPVAKSSCDVITVAKTLTGESERRCAGVTPCTLRPLLVPGVKAGQRSYSLTRNAALLGAKHLRCTYREKRWGLKGGGRTLSACVYPLLLPNTHTYTHPYLTGSLVTVFPWLSCFF